MNRLAVVLLIVLAAGAVLPQLVPAQAQTTEAAGAQRINACSLMSKEEVKKLLPWHDLLDDMAAEEESIGISGSSCNYPTVFIQVLPFSERFLEMVREQEGIETVSGLGEDAYFRNNANEYAEVVAKAGSHVLTVQANADGPVEAVKPNVLQLTRVLIARLQ